MTYLRALQLLTQAYKAARGAMPKGLDLLKLKMKARQKAIDSKKVIEFPKERITNPFKPRPEPYNKLINPKSDTGIKLGKVREGLKKRETEAEMLARMKRQNKEAAQRIRDKKKPRDDKANGGPIDPGYLGIPPMGLGTGSRPGGHPYPSLDYYDDDAGAMKGLMKKKKKKKKKKEDKADGGITGAIKKIKKRFGKKAITTGNKIKRPGNRQLFDDFKKRNKFNTGGLTNISATYDANPTLQAQFPDKQDYLDLFSSTTTTTPQTQTYAQMTQQQPTAGIPAVKPIVPIIPPQGDGDGGGGITAPTGYGYRGPSMTIDDTEEGTITSEEEMFAQGQNLRNLAEKTLLGNLFFKAKDAASDKARDIVNKVRAEEIARAEALQSLQQAIARNQARADQQDWTGATSEYSGGEDPTTGNYDDPYSPGDTE